MPRIYKGNCFRGTVTQSGEMNDGHTYKAIQDCTLRVISCSSDGSVVCQITRREKQKFVDGSNVATSGMPAYLRNYLMTWGSSREIATGTFSEQTKLLSLEGSHPETTAPSSVMWNAHRYFALVRDDRITGVVVNRDHQMDRRNYAGQINLKLDLHETVHKAHGL